MPETPAHNPIARARSLGGNVTVRIERVPGISSAPPTPWNARDGDQLPGCLGDAAQEREEREVATPVRNIFLRP